MRKLIRIYIWLSTLLWVGTFIGIIAAGGLFHNFILLGCMFLCLVMIFFTLGITAFMQSSGLDKIWFKTQEEIEEELERVRAEWEKANTFCKIIGKHEAVKLWEAENKNQSGS